MAEILALDPPREPKPRRFFSGWRAILICALGAIIILGAFFSWWIAGGRLASSGARLDTEVYTVEPQYATTFISSYVHPGQLVAAGQPLGRIDAPGLGMAISEGDADLNAREAMSSELNAAMLAERDMASRVAQARHEEERLRDIWHDLTMRHSSALLRMRAINPQYKPAEYQMARQAVDEVAARMEAARDEFEKRSRMRAAQDSELTKIRGRLNLARRNSRPAEAATVLPKAAESQAASDLYAPVAGKVIKINAEPNQKVNRGEPVFLLLPTDPKNASDYWVDAWYPIADKDALKVGQKARITFPHNGLRLSGEVASVNDAESGSGGEKYVIVRVKLDEPELARKLDPGTKAECRVQTRSIAGFDFFS